jgi:cytochrome bd ubiquinol oxidase subunit II
MSIELAVVAALFAGVLAYAVLGGADFGSGFFDATAGGTARGARLRTLIDRSIGPVWEANHVWLIYVLVMWWTAFPGTFAATMTTLAVPLLLTLLGIVLRGASFAFRKYAATLAQARLFGIVFAGSSLVTKCSRISSYITPAASIWLPYSRLTASLESSRKISRSDCSPMNC